MLANGRFSSRPFTIAGVMCGIVKRFFSGAVLASTTPSDLPTCAAAGVAIAESARTAAPIILFIFIVMLLIVCRWNLNHEPCTEPLEPPNRTLNLGTRHPEPTPTRSSPAPDVDTYTAGRAAPSESSPRGPAPAE